MSLPLSEERVVAGRTPLQVLFDPGSVALVGASTVPGKWGYELATRLLLGRDRRRVELVSRRGEPIAGVPTHADLSDVDGGAELVISAVPPTAFESVVERGLATGTKAFIAVTGGMGELGGEALDHERRVVDRIRRSGARLLGPNCLGVIDTHSELMASAWFDERAQRPGSVAVITQSGTVGLDFELLARRAGLGFSRFASLGNQADITTSELMLDLVTHDPTVVVVVYCESFADGRDVFTAAERLVRAGKPVLLLAPGASAAASRAALSHTGSLTSARATVEAACAAAGVQLLSTTAEAVDAAQALVRTSRLTGKRIGIVADGGGYGVLTADMLDAAGFAVPELTEETRRALADVLGPSATTHNPVDLAAAAAEPGALDAAIGAVVRSGEVDGVVVTGFVGDPPSIDPATAPAPSTIVSPTTAAEAVQRTIPVVVQALFEDSVAVQRLQQLPVATYRTAHSVRDGLLAAERAHREPPGVPVVPSPAAPLTEPVDYVAARRLVASAGIPSPPSVAIDDSPEELRQAAAGLRFPVALKATHLLHKSDAGGVVLGLGDVDAAVAAQQELVRRLDAHQFAVEEMADTRDAVELIIGVQQDPTLGPVALVGLGGLHAEVFKDVELRLAPVDPEQARRAIESLTAFPILAGARGLPPVDVDAAAACLSALSSFAAGHPEIAAIEVNPLLVTPTGAVALDARVILADETHATNDQEHA